MPDIILWVVDFFIAFIKEEFLKGVIVYLTVVLVSIFVHHELTGRWFTIYLRAPRWRNSCIIMLAGHISLIWAWKRAGWGINSWPFLIVFLINVLLDMGLYRYLLKGKSTARKKMERLSDDFSDLLKCYKEWLEIKTEKLEPKDAEYWNKGYYHLLYHMGNIEKSAQIAQRMNISR